MVVREKLQPKRVMLANVWLRRLSFDWRIGGNPEWPSGRVAEAMRWSGFSRAEILSATLTELKSAALRPPANIVFGARYFCESEMLERLIGVARQEISAAIDKSRSIECSFWFWPSYFVAVERAGCDRVTATLSANPGLDRQLAQWWLDSEVFPFDCLVASKRQKLRVEDGILDDPFNRFGY